MQKKLGVAIGWTLSVLVALSVGLSGQWWIVVAVMASAVVWTGLLLAVPSSSSGETSAVSPRAFAHKGDRKSTRLNSSHH